jgi:branched-chain amino acid transport system ATP-binding protein
MLKVFDRRAATNHATNGAGGLVVRDLEASYGPIIALQGISLEVPEEGIVAVLGANGAGKSTLMRAISGLLKPRAGSITFNGRHLERMAAEEIVRQGVIQVPEGRHLFKDLTVMENLRLGAYARRDGGSLDADIERVFTYFPRLRERRAQAAGTMSGGEQQMLAIGRALMARPRLLLLDEPSIGLAPLIVRDIFAIVHAISREEGLAVLVVEQDVNIALEVADHGYVLETGRIVVADSAERLRNDESIRKAYLGY